MNSLLFDSLEIRQFRAFDFLEIEHLGSVNLILGKNNIGKSTLLEALYLHANIGSPLAMQEILENRDEQLSTEYTNFEVLSIWNLFYNYPSLKAIRDSIYIGRSGSPDSALIISSTWDYPDSANDDEDNEAIPSFSIKYGAFRRTVALDRPIGEASDFWSLHRQLKSDDELITPCIFVRPNGLTGEKLLELWDKIALTDAKQDVINALRIIEPEVNDIAIISPKDEKPFCLLRLRNLKQPVPAKSMGDGINRLIGLSMALVCAKDGLLLVDEIENGIHWSVLPDVWKFIVKVAKRLNVQVFATTHSNDCLRAFHLSTKETEGISGIAVRIEKRQGEFHIEVFDEKRLAVIGKEEIEIR